MLRAQFTEYFISTRDCLNSAKLPYMIIHLQLKMPFRVCSEHVVLAE